MEQAYKLLAQQKEISNNKAKELIDRGLVFVGDRQLKIARAQLPEDSRFRIEMPEDITVIYEDEDMVAVNKPAGIDSYEVQDSIAGTELLHRLDRDTSGVLLLGKNKEFIKDAVKAFKQRKVSKEYIAWVEGVVYEEIVIDTPIHTIKKGKAFSKIDERIGRPAHTEVYPDEVQGKKSKVKIMIATGRTHQIRVHLASVGHPVVGDSQYGSRTRAKRALLHARKIGLLGKEFVAPVPTDIKRYK
ncbi:MAG: RluA family pseudouridine synthase [Sulfurovum sp.]|nr:RluA family pseudouridine synthase [Sulfurovum sp.]